MNDLIISKKKREKAKNLIIYFLVYALMGWILETIYAFLVHKHFVNRGFLFGPLCPIYGFGAVILILLLENSKGKPSKEFLVAAFAFTIFEYMASYVLEVLFNMRWWDYTNDFMNLQGRVSLAYSIIWGAMGIILIEGIHPIVSKNIEKIKKHMKVNLQNTLVIFITLLVITDFTYSVITYIK